MTREIIVFGNGLTFYPTGPGGQEQRGVDGHLSGCQRGRPGPGRDAAAHRGQPPGTGPGGG